MNKEERERLEEYYSSGGHHIRVINIDSRRDGEIVNGEMTGSIMLHCNIVDFTVNDKVGVLEYGEEKRLEEPLSTELSRSLRVFKSNLERQVKLISHIQKKIANADKARVYSQNK